MTIEIEKAHAGYILRAYPQHSLVLTAQDLRDIYDWCLHNMKQKEAEAAQLRESEQYHATPEEEAIQANLLAVQVTGQIQQAYADDKIDRETYNQLFEIAQRAHRQVHKLANLLGKPEQNG